MVQPETHFQWKNDVKWMNMHFSTFFKAGRSKCNNYNGLIGQATWETHWGTLHASLLESFWCILIRTLRDAVHWKSCAFWSRQHYVSLNVLSMSQFHCKVSLKEQPVPQPHQVTYNDLQTEQRWTTSLTKSWTILNHANKTVHAVHRIKPSSF